MLVMFLVLMRTISVGVNMEIVNIGLAVAFLPKTDGKGYGSNE